jgi:hypothetical protein
MDKLWECGFRGIVLLDDIWHPDPSFREGMQRMWNDLPWRKHDITLLGHWSGTGLVFMNETDILQIDSERMEEIPGLYGDRSPIVIQNFPVPALGSY